MREDAAPSPVAPPISRWEPTASGRRMIGTLPQAMGLTRTAQSSDFFTPPRLVFVLDRVIAIPPGAVACRSRASATFDSRRGRLAGSTAGCPAGASRGGRSRASHPIARCRAPPRDPACASAPAPGVRAGRATVPVRRRGRGKTTRIRDAGRGRRGKFQPALAAQSRRRHSAFHQHPQRAGVDQARRRERCRMCRASCSGPWRSTTPPPRSSARH